MRVSSILNDVRHAELNINFPPVLNPNNPNNLDDPDDLGDLDDLDNLDDPDPKQIFRRLTTPNLL